MRKLVSILLVLLLSTALLIPVQAATQRIMYQNYDVEGSYLSLYGTPMPVGGDLTVSVGSEKMAGATMSTIAEAQVPVTVYFLVDASTSLSDATKKQQTDILTVISSHLGENDTMVIATIDETFFEGPLLTNKEDRDSAIETIGRKDNWLTNLHMGIDKAVDSLSTSTAFNTNRYLVILSDGQDNNREKVSVDTLSQKITNANLPIFNLILGPAAGSATTADIEYLTKLDEASLGGYICRLGKENVSAAEAAENVWSTIQSNSVIRFNGANLDTSADVEVLIRYDYKDTRYEDTVLLRAVDLQKRLVLPSEPSTAETVADTVLDDDDDDDDETNTTVLYIGGGALLIAVIAVVAFLLLKPKKTQSSTSSYNSGFDSYGQDSGSFIDTSDSFGDGSDSFGGNADPGVTGSVSSDTSSIGNTVFADFSGGNTAPVGGGIHVSLVALMHPEISCEFTLGEGAETTMGRDSRSTVVLNGSDRKLSGVHAGILWDGVHLLIRDKKSTNGTSVNGSPCTGDAWYLLENGATLKAGAYEYRVNYQNNSPAM